MRPEEDTDQDVHSSSWISIFTARFDITVTLLLTTIDCNSKPLLPVFGARVSVTFHLTCAHIVFSSVSVAEWPRLRAIAAQSVDHMFSLYFDYL